MTNEARPEKKNSTATKWEPFSPDYGMGRRSAVDRVMLLRSGSIRISDDIVERMGRPTKIQLLTNGSRDAFAICAATSPVASAALSRAGRQSEFRIGRLFAALGKDAEQITWPLDLPHSWEGAVLVIEVSAVPAARPPMPAEQDGEP